jgi:hypothetical protein
MYINDKGYKNQSFVKRAKEEQASKTNDEPREMKIHPTFWPQTLFCSGYAGWLIEFVYAFHATPITWG